MHISKPLVDEILNQGMILDQALMAAIDRRINDRKNVKVASLKKNKQKLCADFLIT